MTEKPAHIYLLQTWAPGSASPFRPTPSAQPALPAKKDKADDGGKGKNQVCTSTKYINLFGQGERGKNSSGGESHAASSARSLLL